jgi:hypothetical protein
MISQTDTGVSIFPESEFRRFHDERVPATGSVIMLARLIPEVDPHGLRYAVTKGTSIFNRLRDQRGRPIQLDEGSRAGLVMFAINHLVVTVLIHNLPYELDIAFTPPDPGLRWETHFRQLWPLANERLQWPPRLLNEVGGFDGWWRTWTS